MAHAIAIPELTERGWAVQVHSAGTMDFTGTAPAIPTWATCCQNSTPPQKDGSTFVQDPVGITAGQIRFEVQSRKFDFMANIRRWSRTSLSTVSNFCWNGKARPPFNVAGDAEKKEGAASRAISFSPSCDGSDK